MITTKAETLALLNDFLSKLPARNKADLMDEGMGDIVSNLKYEIDKETDLLIDCGDIRLVSDYDQHNTLSKSIQGLR